MQVDLKFGLGISFNVLYSYMLLSRRAVLVASSKLWNPKIDFLAIFLLLFVANQASAQTPRISSLKEKLLQKTQTDSKDYIELVNQLAESFYNYYPDSTLYYSLESKALSEKIQHKEGLVDAYRNLGAYYNRISDYQTAAEYLREGLNLAESLDYPKGYANLLSTFARNLEDRGYYTTAISYYLLSLKIKEESNLIHELPATLNNLGLAVYKTKEYERALGYFNRALDLRKELGDTLGIAPLLTNIALVFRQQGKYDEALKYLSQTLKAAEESDNDYLKSVSLHNIGEIHISLKEYDKALSSLNESIRLDREMIDNQGVVLGLIGVGKSYIGLNRLGDAIKHLNEALELAKNSELKAEASECHQLISGVHELRREWVEALYHHKAFKTLTDELFNADSTRIRRDFEEKYKLEREEASFLQVQRERELERSQEIAKTIRNGVSVLLVIMALALGVTIRSFIIQRKARLQVTQQKDELERLYLETNRQKAEIESIAANLDEVNKTKDKLFGIVSHDLRSPINSLNSLMQYTLDENLSQQEFLKISHELKNEVEHVHFTLINLLHWAKSQMKGITTDASNISINELVEENIELYKPIAMKKGISLINEVVDPTFCWADRDQINLVFRNLINNALKFTSTGGSIIISREEKEDGYWKITVKDTGIGMSSSTIQKLFKPDFQNKQYGTAGEKGTGLGLLLVKDFILANHGDIYVESHPGNGSCFIFTLPKAPDKPVLC